MKYLLLPAFCSIILGMTLVAGQSGRKNSKPAPVPTPTPLEEPKPVKPPARQKPLVAVVPNEEYKCLDDGSLGVVVPSSEAEKVFAPDEVTTKAKITSRPAPEYTKEARRRAVQGNISFRVVLAATGKVASVKILKGLPFGLNENAIHAACKIEFRPALKDGQPVTQWLKGEYTFRLESSIFRH